MPSFSETSRARLLTCHPDLQRLFNKVVETRDCSVIYGFRGKNEQNAAFDNGFSKLRWPESKHNRTPSLAVDVMPYSVFEPHIRWNDSLGTYNFIGYVQRVADELGIKIRNGADWDMDLDFEDQSFMDPAHYELVLDNR